MRTGTLVATVAIPIAALLLADAAGAASCREALEEFERRLNDSTLASTAPDAYANLAREAANAAELRDEELCMQRVAELNAALPADGAAPTPIKGTIGEAIGETNAQPSAETPGPAPPAAPLLLDAGPVDYEVESSSEEPAAPPADDNDVD